MNIESFNSDQHLSYEELVEYSRGNLSNSEMHRLEQHLIGCELCNEALEGVSLLGYDDASSSVEKIKEATGSTKSFELGTNHYIGIAASVVIIAVLGFLFTRTGGDESRLAEEAAKTDKQDESIASRSEDIPADPQTIAIDSAMQAEDTLLIAATDTYTEAPDQEEVFIDAEITDAGATEQLAIQTQPVADTGQSTEVILADLDMALDSTSVDGADSVLVTEAAFAEEPDQAAMARKAAEPAETERSTELNEVALTDQGTYVAAQPEKGLRSYNRYLKRNMVYPERAKENSIEGDIVLLVSIDTDGSIFDVVVNQSLGYGCDEEAIRLVREGPSWTPATRGGALVSDRVSVTVTFKQ